jgi:cobaltochelatase CobT
MKSKTAQINKIKEDLTATLRALVADDFLQVDFTDDQKNNFFSLNQKMVFEKKKVVLPEIKDESSINHRAACDLAACYVLFHDAEIHQSKNFDSEEQKIFDDFEKVRVISEVRNSYFGIVKNILTRLENDIFSGSNNISLLLLSEFFSDKILPRTKSAIADLEKKLGKKISSEIKKLAKTSNQSDFANSVERLIEMLRQEQESDEKNESEKEQQKKSKDDLKNFGQENVESENESTPSESETISKQQEQEPKISELKKDDAIGEVSLKSQKQGSSADEIKYKNAYKIYSSQFDEVIFPQKLTAKNDLESWRDQLDLKLAKLSTISRKMSFKLKRKLLSKQNSFLEYDATRGILDRKKLTRLIIDPLLEDVWISSKIHEYQDTALTILLDNSGSMRGNPIIMSAMACEIIASILEKFSIKTEIIGFTTADWKGGRARKLWEGSGRPRNPGRLNELRHIIYKSFNQSFKKSKINLGLMLKEGILKENIDGEALLFARSRLSQQSEKRKILIVISDGTPVDDSTSLANDTDILSDHLRHVINKIEKQSKIEIVGIGIGHTTEEFYRNSITIRSLEELGDVMIEKITQLL